MKYILAIFSSRNETMFFYNLIKQHGIMGNIINTPREASNACGISVKFLERDFSLCQSIIQNNHFVSFYGFYFLYDYGFNYDIKRI